MTHSSFPSQQEESSLDIKQEFLKYIKYWRWFLASLLVFMAVAFVYLRYSPLIYQSSAKVKILDDSKKQGINLEAAFFRMQKVNLENEIEIIKSYRLIKPVVQELKLTTGYFTVGKITTKEIWGAPFEVTPYFSVDSLNRSVSFTLRVTPNGFQIKSAKGKVLADTKSHTVKLPSSQLPFQIAVLDGKELKKNVGETYKVVFYPLDQTTKSLVARLNVSSVGKESEILQIALNDGCIEKSEAILNKIIDQFNGDGIKDRQLVSQRTIDFVDDRFIYLSGELETIEKDKKEYKQENQLSYIEADAGLSIQKKASSEEEYNRLGTQVALSKILNETIGKDKGFSLLPGNIGLDNAGINAQVAEYNKAVLERDKLISSAGINNPTVKLLQARLADLQTNLLDAVRTYQKQLSVTLQRLTSLKQKASGMVSALPEKEKQLRAIERQQKIKENLYLILLQKREEAAINLAVTAPSVKVVEFAMTNLNPVSPKRNIIYLGAMLLGLLVPFGILYVRFLLNTKIQGKKDIEAIVGDVPILSEIPKITADQKTVEANDRSVLAEAFRVLSTNMNYILPVKEKGEAKIVFVTSSIKGEGKTFVSLNLSLILASHDKKVLLIGADLRNPQLHSYYNTDKSAKGLTDYLHLPQADWRDYLQEKILNERHVFLLSGSIPPNPSNLLDNGRFEQLLEEAKNEYDYIIVDTAPTVLVSDTLLISKCADATIYVTRANYTEKELLHFSADLARRKKLNNLAYVINDMDYKSDGYNYGYGYGYSADGPQGSAWWKRMLGK